MSADAFFANLIHERTKLNIKQKAKCMQNQIIIQIKGELNNNLCYTQIDDDNDQPH